MSKNKDKKKNLDSPPPPYLRYFKLMLLGIIMAIFLGAELIGRYLYHVNLSKEEDLLFRAFLGLGSTFNPNMVSNYLPHHYLIYILNPNVQFHYKTYYGKQAKHFINRHGYRGKEFSIEKPAGTYRIVCIGASTTFSLLEPEEDKTYPALLETALNGAVQGGQFEVINAGTPGWSSAESFINFHFRVRTLNPDMIIIYHAVNDAFAMRYPNEGESDYSGFRRIIDYSPPSPFVTKCVKVSGLARFAYYKIRGFTSDINSLARRPFPMTNEEMYKNFLSAKGTNFVRNMEGMVQLAKANNITPVLMTMGHTSSWNAMLRPVNELTRQIAKKHNVLLVDFEKEATQPDLFASDGVHMTRQGNQFRAQFLMGELTKHFKRT